MIILGLCCPYLNMKKRFPLEISAYFAFFNDNWKRWGNIIVNKAGDSFGGDLFFLVEEFILKTGTDKNYKCT